MKLIISGRRSGKTTRMIDWLLEGEAIDAYPGWSRVIACANEAQVRFTTDLVRQRTKTEWDNLNKLFNKSYQTMSEGQIHRLRALSAVRKAVWGPSDTLGVAQRGISQDVELGFDNLDDFLHQQFHWWPRVKIATVDSEGIQVQE